MKPYRGLTKDGKWVYGWYVGDGWECSRIIPTTGDYGSYGSSDDVKTMIGPVIEVLPESVAQQIGLKDKNGKDVHDEEKLRSGKRVFTVIWDSDSMQWKAQEEDGTLTPLCQWAITEQFEIIENPELLKCSR